MGEEAQRLAAQVNDPFLPSGPLPVSAAGLVDPVDPARAAGKPAIPRPKVALSVSGKVHAMASPLLTTRPMPLLAPPFPRAVNLFVGRQEELSRVRELLKDEVLFLVYGIGGIGKSEFVYKVIEEARASPPFRSAPPLLVQARGNLSAEHLVSVLRQRLGHGRTPLDGCTSFEDDLAEVARALDARPYLVFIDDIHTLDADAAAGVLGYLSRHVQRSRIFAASRLEVLLPQDTPPPVITRLRPLDQGATGAMVAMLSRSMGLLADAGQNDQDGERSRRIFQRSGGSPFYIRREVANLRFVPQDDGDGQDPLGRSLRDLSAEARGLLVLARLMRGRLATADLLPAVTSASADPSGTHPSAAIWELCRRFLIDIERGVVTVHDLIWDALCKQVRPEELDAARRAAAALHLRRFDTDPRRHAVDAVEAVQHLLRSGDLDAAWDAVSRSYGAIAKVELDHLLLDVLPALRGAEAGERRVAVDLLRARILLRRSHVAEAEALLRELGQDPSASQSVRHLVLLGEVAQRHGKLTEAMGLYARAQDRAASPRQRFLVALSRANVSSLSGRGEEAREVLRAARVAYPAPAPLDAGRWGWSLALSLLLDDRLEEAATAAAASLGRDQGEEGALVPLAMLEAIARVEIDEVPRARALLDQILFSAAASGALREHAASLYRGVVCCAEGDLPTARLALEGAFTSLAAHGDYAPAAVAGYYLGTTLLCLGDVEGALSAAERAGTLARNAGLLSIAPHADALSARALLHALRLDEAGERAAQALRVPAPFRVPARVRAQAHHVIAWCHALRGDLVAAREALANARGAQQGQSPDPASPQDARGPLDEKGQSPDPASPQDSPGPLDEKGQFPDLASPRDARAPLGEKGQSPDPARPQDARGPRAPRDPAAAALFSEHELETAELGPLLGESGAVLVKQAERTRKHYLACGRRHHLARAELALAIGRLLCGDDVSAADAALGRAVDLCTENGYGPLLLRCTLVEAAIARRRGDDREAPQAPRGDDREAPQAPRSNDQRSRALLLRGLAGADPAAHSLELALLREAVKAKRPVEGPGQAPGETGGALPGTRAVLLKLGLLAARRHEIFDRAGRRDADEGEIALARGTYELVVDLDRATLLGAAPAAGAITGRPLMCALLFRLLQADTQVVGAETLFHEVWGGREYHPLQHRNTIYVAITRLRRALRELLPGREIIETAPSGWRLADDANVCAIRKKD